MDAKEPTSVGRFEAHEDPGKGARQPSIFDSLDNRCQLEKSSVTSIRTTPDDLTSARGTLRNIKQRRPSTVCVAKYGKNSVVEPEDIVKCMVLRNTPSNTTLHGFPTPSLSPTVPTKSSSSENSSTSSEPLTVIARLPEETKADEADHTAPTEVPSAVTEALKRFRAKGFQLTLTQRKPGCVSTSKAKELAVHVNQEQEHRSATYVSKRRLQLRNDTASTVSSSSTCTTTDGNEFESHA
ncbi:hypothetical protein AAVH_07438 [Aphelenchoides avenae]|nr:hypothetical protein AAVH_07438 [Aphelenchus avenae]